MSQLEIPSARRATPAERSADEQSRRTRFGQRVRAIVAGVIVGFIVTLLILGGSRGFQWFDAALIGYAVGTIFAAAAITYKYTFWLMRPQTGRYFKRGWEIFFSRQYFRRYATLVPSAIITGLLAQTFIRKRSYYRWITHLCIFWGVILSLCVTIPLTFGWLHFTQETNGSGLYLMWAAGFPLFAIPPYSFFALFVFHALDFSALLLLVGLILAFHRRFHDIANIAIQRFSFDLVPLALLFAIAVTGLALTADSVFFRGAFYWYISLVHEAVVVFWLISLPFGKFFHILERPATVGIELYWRAGQDGEQHRCPRCGEAFAPQMFVSDLKRTLNDIGQDYAVTAGKRGGRRARGQPAAAPTASVTDFTWWQDFCPECKRVMRAEANLGALGREGNQFL